MLFAFKASSQTTVTLIAPPAGITCTNTFEYSVCQASSSNAISHWILGLPTCITAADVEAVYLNGELWNLWTVGTDPSCNSYGLKWDDIQVPAGTCKTFKVVFKDSYLVSSNFWYSKFGTTCVQSGPVVTPSCTKCVNAGSISNFVWNDTNNNGTQDAGEVGVAGVTVSLLNASGTVITSTVTDGLGNYLFSNLETSSGGVNYQVQFALPAGYQFAPSIGAVSVTTNSDANTATGKTGTITLTTSQPNVTYADAGIYYTAISKIGDFVWNDLDKDGIQDAGEPGIAGVTVILYTSTGVLYQSTITADNGSYLFTDVPAGSYYLVITQPAGYVITTKDAGGDVVDSDFDPATSKTALFTVTASTQNLSLDAGLYVTPNTGASASVGDKVWLDLNNNNLQDAGEPGVAGVTVRLRNSSGVVIATTTTDVFGNYIFNGLVAGVYDVQFVLPGGYTFVTAVSGTNAAIDSDANTVTGITAAFNLFNDQMKLSIDAGLRSTSAATAAIGNFVWYDLNKNGVQDGGSEAGVPGITVKLYNGSNAVVQTTTTDANGFYLFTGLPSSTAYTIGYSNLPAGYSLTVKDAGGNDNTDSDADAGTGRTATVTTGAAGSVNTSVDAGIIASPNTFDSKGSIGDKVWNDLNNNGIADAGEPGIAGVTVTLYAANGTTVIATTTTDAQGNYVFTNLNAGTYILGFSNYPSGYVFTALNAGADDTKDSDVDGTTGKTSAVTLAAGEINTSVDAGLRNPATTSNIGDFVWYDLNQNGLQDSGEPGAEGVSVTLYNASGVAIKNTTTDTKGFYLFTDLAPGSYFVKFGNLPNGYNATVQFAAGSNAATANNSDANATTLITSVIVLGSGVTETNRADLGLFSTTKAAVGDYVWNDADADGVQDAGEAGIAGVTVTLYNTSGSAVATAVTDANGFYFFANVNPGTYTIGFSTLPANSGFTYKDAGADAADSDVNYATGTTDAFTVAGGTVLTTIDAGLLTYQAAVGNYVWNDKLQNGIQDATENGIPGITVLLYSTGADGAIGNGDDYVVASAVTNAAGYFFINNIPVGSAPSNFYIRFSDLQAFNAFTYYNLGTADNNSNVVSTSPIDGKTDVFTLTANGINLTIDAGIVGPDNSTLPADGLSLAALYSNSNVTLNWQTLSEINTDYFEIERGVTANSGFVKIGVAKAAGNSASSIYYSLMDNISTLQQNGVLYYRVKLVDADGKYKYSNTVVVRLKAAQIKVWPNPFAETVQVSITSETNSKVVIRLNDISGKTVLTQSQTVGRGVNQLAVRNLQSIPKGAYILEIYNEGEQSKTAFKITKQ